MNSIHQPKHLRFQSPLPRVRLLLRSLLMAGLLVGLLGCAGQGYIRSADESARAGRYKDAVAIYKQALMIEPSLERDSDFMAKYDQARVNVLLVDARSAYVAGKFDDAVKLLRDAVDLDPHHMAAIKFLVKARIHAINDLHQRALQNADEGKLASAIGLAKRILRYDSLHQSAKAMLDSVDPKRAKDDPTKADQAYAQSKLLIGQKSWFKAVDGFTSVLKLDTNHLPARVATHLAIEELKRSAAHLKQGQKLIKTGQLNEAIDQLQLSLKVWPANQEAIEWLVDARVEHDKAKGLFEQSVAASKARQWDKAIAAVNQCIDLYPFYPNSGSFLKQIKLDAAADHVVAGRQNLNAGQLDEAKARFQRAFKYTMQYAPAIDGMAQIAVARAKKAHAAGQLGLALLWYRQARDLAPEPKYQQQLAVAHQSLENQVKFAILVVEPNSKDSDDTAAFGQSIGTQLLAGKPAFIEVRQSTEAKDNAPPLLYLLDGQVSSLDCQSEKIKTENANHRYTVYQDVINPRITELRYWINQASVELGKLAEPYQHYAAACRSAHYRYGTRHSRYSNYDPLVCRQARRLAARIAYLKNRMLEMETELRGQPDRVKQPITTSWPYQIDHYEKICQISVEIEIAEVSGRHLDALVLSKRRIYRDQVISKANPEVGLAEDPLEIPSDTKAQKALMDAVAKDGISHIMIKVLEHRAMALNRQARKLEEQGDADKARELNIQAAVLLQPVDPNQAAKILKQLQTQLR
jgi:tetratricopeptide (TPR) repeat protein